MKTLKIKYKTLIKYIYSLGYIEKRIRSSHIYYTNGNKTICIVKKANHYTIGQGLLVEILRDLKKDINDLRHFLTQKKITTF